MNPINTSIVNQFYPSIPSWLIEIINQPILLILAFAFGYFLYIKYKNKIKNNEFQLTDNQSKFLLLGGTLVVVLIAHKYLGM